MGTSSGSVVLMSELPVGGPAFAVFILRESILAKGLQQYFHEHMLGG